MPMASAPRHPATQLVFLGRGPIALRAFVVLLAAVGTGAAGVALSRWELQLAAEKAHAEPLNPLLTVLATGSGPRTAWVGWLAALFFAAAASRVRRGPLEPSASRRPVDELTPGQLRSGLRREYTAARVLLVLIILAGAIDMARAIALATTTAAVAQSTLLWSFVEAAGLLAAALVLALWTWWFSADVRRLGAI